MTTWRRDVLASSLPLAAKVVGLVLYEHMDWDGPDAGGNCWPSLAAIGLESGLDRRTVTRSLAALLEAGYVERRCRRGCEVCRGGNGHLMAYTAHVPERQQGHDATAEQGHDATADERSAGATVHSAGATVQPAGASRHRQQGRHATRPSLDLPKDPSDLPVGAAARRPRTCPTCSDMGQVRVRSTDPAGRPMDGLSPCPDCQPSARSA